jgi:outer membrane receptor for ferrienterochelin and colicins
MKESRKNMYAVYFAKKSTFPYFYFLGTLALSHLAVAQAMPDQLDVLRQMSLAELMTVTIVTIAKHEEPLRDSPAQVRVISREQIQARRYVSLADVLQDLPGVDMQRATKSSSFNNPILQGHESNNKFLILQNGVRIDHPAGGKLPVAENFPLYHVKQIEILYGPAAALYGADAFAGVINLITERADAHQGLYFSSRVGKDDYRHHQALLGVKFGEKLALTVGGHRHGTDRAFLPQYYPAEFAPADAKTFAGEVLIPAALREDYTSPVASRSAYARLDVGADFSLMHQYSYFRSLTSTGDRPDTALFLNEAAWHTQLNSTYGQYHLDVNSTLALNFMFNHSRYEVSPQSKYLNIFTNFEDHGYDYAASRKNEAEAQTTWRLNPDHTLVAGLSYAAYATRELPDMPRPFDPSRSSAEQGLFYENTDLAITDLRAHFHNQAAYAQLGSRWTPQFSTTIGLRYDYNSAYGDSFNPRVGIVYRHTSPHVFKLMYGEGIRAPSSEESFSTFGAFSGERNAQGEYISSGFRVPNFNLEPEKMRSVAAVWEWQINNNLRFSLNPYYAMIDNLISTREELTPTQFLAGAELRNTTIKDNLGRERHYGADMELNYRYVSGSWHLDSWGSYSYIQGQVKEINNTSWDLPYISPHKLKLGATLYYQKRYFITPKFYYFSAANTGRKDPNNAPARLQSPGYTLMDVHIGMTKVVKNLELYMDIYNALDRRYYHPGGSGSTTFVSMPQAPRSVMLGLEYRFF